VIRSDRPLRAHGPREWTARPVALALALAPGGWLLHDGGRGGTVAKADRGRTR
jgi:hypothetical protein